MRPSRRVTVALGTVVLAGGAAALVAGLHRAPEPLPPLAETAFEAPSPGVALPFHLRSRSRCPSYAFDSPVAAPANGNTEELGLAGPGEPAAAFTVLCQPDAQIPFGSLDAYVDALRRKADEMGLVGDPVIENGPLGAAVRTEERMAQGASRLTEWRVERAGTVVMVGYLRHTEDHSHDAEVQSMLASWTWG